MAIMLQPYIQRIEGIFQLVQGMPFTFYAYCSPMIEFSEALLCFSSHS